VADLEFGYSSRCCLTGSVLDVTTEHRFSATEATGEVSALLMRPKEARCLYVFGHGAGAGMRHSFMEACALRLCQRGIATFRYAFPYMEAGRKFPDRAPVLMETVEAALVTATTLAPELPLFAGGKSMGGRMTSLSASTNKLPRLHGLAFFGFPLHAAGRDSKERGLHLAEVGVPMLFLQGDRDKLANLGFLTALLEGVLPSPALHVVDGADHGFHVLKRSGRTDAGVLDELCDAFSGWVDAVL
jgi:predicted alpha/beta-hydrolase family hydrolase